MSTHLATCGCSYDCVYTYISGHHVMIMWVVMDVLVKLIRMVMLQRLCLLLLEEYLGWHVLYLDKSCHSVIRVALRPLLVLHLTKSEDVRLGELLRLAMLEVLGHEVGACRNDIRICHLGIHLMRALLAHGTCLGVRQR